MFDQKLETCFIFNSELAFQKEKVDTIFCELDDVMRTFVGIGIYRIK